MTYDNELKGALFKNGDKRDGRSDPDYRGSVTVNRTEYWVSAWINESKKGEKYMALALTPKQTREHSANREKPAPAEFADDDIPF